MGKKSKLRKENEELRKQVERLRLAVDGCLNCLNDTLVITDVDLGLLEKQTELVAGLLGEGGIRPDLRDAFEDYWDRELEALSGIVNMLEAWTADREE